ncbi:MAG: TlpA disulfide reductase family protein [Gammaproteobacteria bacterium]|nr:TlpA disulfide reductase family protein [Gammaproteobacteria bacterium]
MKYLPLPRWMGLWLVLGMLPVQGLPAGEMPETIPLFTLSDIDGNQVVLESFRGSVVMINFWATWCAPCIEEMPTMQALKESLADEPFEILAINMGEDLAAIRSFLERTGFNFSFPILLDPATEVATRYAVQGLPATLLADKSGKYVFGGIGAKDWNGTEARDQILPLLAR